MGYRVHRGHRAHKGYRAHRGHKAHKGYRVHMGHRAHRGHRADIGYGVWHEGLSLRLELVSGTGNNATGSRTV